MDIQTVVIFNEILESYFLRDFNVKSNTRVGGLARVEIFLFFFRL